jgi:hypothetical protein
LIYGETQIGKSTWINYLHGVEYQFVVDAQGLMPTAKRKGGAEEIVTVGTGGGSETIYPRIILDKARDDINYKFIDMPGFGDTRNDEERICVVSSNKLLLHKLTNVKIKGIMFAISYQDLTQGAHTNLRRILPKMKRVLNGQYDNFVFVITKIPESEKGVDLKIRVTNELMKFRSVIEKEINDVSNSDNESIKEKKDTEEVLKTIILNNDRIIIGDIFNQDVRTLVLNSLNLFKAQDPKVFNFDINFNERQGDPINEFKKSMGCVAREYIDLYNKQENIKKEGLVLRNNIVLKQNTLNTKDEEIRLTNIKIDRSFTLDKGKIESLEKNIGKLKTCIEVSRDEIYKLKLEPESIRDEIERMRNNTQLYTIDTYNDSWDQQPKHEKETGLYTMVFGESSCDSNNAECVTRNAHRDIDAKERGRIKNAIVNYTIQQPYSNHTIAIADYKKNRLYGCIFTEGAWLNDGRFVADTQQFRKNLQTGIFQGKIDGTAIGDGLNKYIATGTIYVSIALLGQENSRKEILDDIIAKEKQIAAMEERSKLEENILNVRLIEQAKKERELQRLNEAPQKDIEEKQKLREELKKLEENTNNIREEIRELEEQKQKNVYLYKNTEAVLQQNVFKKIATLLDILSLDSNELIEFSTLVNNIFLRIEKPSLTDQMYHEGTPVMANGAADYYDLNNNMCIVYDRPGRMSAARETISYQFFMFTVRPINFFLQRTKIISQQLLLSFYQYHHDEQQKSILGGDTRAIVPMILSDPHHKNTRQAAPFDKGLWDDTVQQHPSTGMPLFTYRVFKDTLEVGSAIFYKHPLICRSEDGTRHNIIALTGVLAKYDDIGEKLQTIENICESLPPTFTQELIQVTVRGAQHGAIKGAANTISYTLDKGGFSKQASYYANCTIYYGGMFTLHYTYRYQDIASDIPEVQKIATVAFQAAVDTATLAFTQTVIHQGCKLINWFGQKVQQYSWEKTGSTLQWLSGYAGYGSYAYQAYSQGVLHTGVSIVSGATSEKILEKIGKYTVAKLLAMNGFLSIPTKRPTNNSQLAQDYRSCDQVPLCEMGG